MNMRDEVEKTLLEFCENEHKFIEDGVAAIMRLVEPDFHKLVDMIRNKPRNHPPTLLAHDVIEAWRNGKLIKPQTYGAAGMTGTGIEGFIETVREANTPDKEDAHG